MRRRVRVRKKRERGKTEELIRLDKIGDERDGMEWATSCFVLFSSFTPVAVGERVILLIGNWEAVLLSFR